jgi:hypothetical protein
MENQVAYSFDKESVKKIGKGILIAGGAAILTYLAENLGNFDFGNYTGIVVAVLSILINIGKSYVEGK